MDNLCFFTDMPPLKENSLSNHGVACEFTKILKKNGDCLLTHRFRRSISKKNIIDSCHGIPTTIYADLSCTGLKRFAPRLSQKIDADIFALYSGHLVKRLITRYKTNRFLVLCGDDPYFLYNIRALQKTGLPVDLYFVDDIEESWLKLNSGRHQSWLKPLLAEVIRSCDRVFAISKGFVERLDARFGCRAEWLPLPSAAPPLEPKCARMNSTRVIVFTGGLNHLYTQALRELYEEISDINRERPLQAPFELHLLTYSEPESFLRTLPNRSWVKVFQNLPVDERKERMGQAYACFLPYSFEDEERIMVSTSFSCKILEYFSAGVPLLAYGPAYASIPRYFQDEGLPACATSRAELRVKLLSIENLDCNEAHIAYMNSWRRNHSPEAIRSILSNKPN
jgi:hypothetical protein